MVTLYLEKLENLGNSRESWKVMERSGKGVSCRKLDSIVTVILLMVKSFQSHIGPLLLWHSAIDTNLYHGYKLVYYVACLFIMCQN